MSMAIAVGANLIVDEKLAELFGVQDVAVTYAPGCLTDAIREALLLTAVEREDRRSRLGEIRSAALATSLGNLPR